VTAGGRLVLLAGGALLVSCVPAPRAVAYFKLHADEAAHVVAACKAGSARGRECDNAQLAIAQVESNALAARRASAFQAMHP
jgi:hypothetical protein